MIFAFSLIIMLPNFVEELKSFLFICVFIVLKKQICFVLNYKSYLLKKSFFFPKCKCVKFNNSGLRLDTRETNIDGY